MFIRPPIPLVFAKSCPPTRKTEASDFNRNDDIVTEIGAFVAFDFMFGYIPKEKECVPERRQTALDDDKEDYTGKWSHLNAD